MLSEEKEIEHPFTENGKYHPIVHDCYVSLKEKYKSWGIYRKLYTEFKHKVTGNGASNETFFNIGYQYTYKVKCKNRTGSSSHNIIMLPGSPISPITYEFSGSYKKIEHYKGTRCLSSFSLSSWASFKDRCSYSIFAIYNIGEIKS